MKESFAKIQAWIKAHPKLSIAIGVVIVVIGYFVLKSTGGNPTGEPGTEPIDGGALGANESGGLDLGGLGTSAAAMPPVTSGGESAPSLVSSLPSITGSGDSAAFDMGTASGFDPYAYMAPVAAFNAAAPVSNESLVTNKKVNTMSKPANLPIVTPAKITTNVPVKATASPVKGLSTITSASAAKPTAQPVKAATVVKSVTSSVKGLSTNTSAGSLNKYSGFRAGYYWNGKTYVRVPGR